jgi:hypothetical protein
MGRGRQKAKHTKVARELKYFSPETDYSQLERELGAGAGSSSGDEFDADTWTDSAAGVDVDAESASTDSGK